MEKEQAIIEVEVLEIDGIAPAPVFTEQEKTAHPRAPLDWQKWLNRLRKLDGRFWPVWVLLGVVALFLLLTVGIAAGVLFLIHRFIRDFLSGVASVFKPVPRND